VSTDHSGLSEQTVTSSLRRLAGNAASLLTSSALNRATTFVLYALVARYLSPFEFGQMSLALTYFYMFQVLAVAGLETLMIRVVANDRARTGEYFLSGSLLVVVFSLLSMSALFAVLRLLNYSRETAAVILLLSLGLLPYSLSIVCQTVFQAWERMHYIAYANIPINIAKVGLAFLFLSKGYGLYHLVLLLVASFVAQATLQGWLMFRYIAKPRLSIDLRLSLWLTRSARTFLGIEVVIALMASLSTVLLSKLASETEVGFYSAAAQLAVPLHIVYQSIVVSVFPLMCRKFGVSFTALRRITQQLTELMLAIALPAAIGLFFLSDFALELLYGSEFRLASGTLRILSWSLIFAALAVALGQALFAGVKERITLRIVLVNLAVTLVAGFILISQFGLLGAALTALVKSLVDAIQHYASVSRLLAGLSLARLAWKPAVASLCMAVSFIGINAYGPILAALTASIVYVAVLLALMIQSNGGYHRFKGRVAQWYLDGV
jgi:O-antigen/teichoic acid export membrane protein